jgi:hypothetical protein
MLTLATMVRAGVAIRGGVTWPTVYTLLPEFPELRTLRHSGSGSISW